MAVAGGARLIWRRTAAGEHAAEEDSMNLAHPHFAEPRWLWLALVGPLLLFALQRYSAWRRNRQLAQLASEHFLGELTRSHSPFRRELKNIMLLAALGAAGLAL